MHTLMLVIGRELRNSEQKLNVSTWVKNKI
jgi:hypothetical protein